MSLIGALLSIFVCSAFGAARGYATSRKVSAPLALSTLVAGSGLLMPWLWVWCRETVGVGYLGMLTNSTAQDQQFRAVLFTLAIGPFGAGILLWIAGSTSHARKSRAFEIATRHRPSDSAWVLGGLLACLVVFIAGQGSSIFERAEYLDASGPAIFTRAAGLSNLVAIALTFTGVRDALRAFSRIAISMTVSVFVVLLAAVASRTAGLLFVSAVLASAIRRRRAGKSVIWVLTAGVVGTLFLFELVLSSRLVSHGIAHLHTNSLAAFLALGNWTEIQRICALVLASILVTVVVVPRSIGTASSELIIANLNPLIGVGSDAMAYSTQGAERLYPYVWTPLSTAGQAYGALGPAWIIGTLFALSILVHTATSRAASTGPRRMLQVGVSGLYLLQLLHALEYSTRQWSRIFSFTVVASFFLLFLEHRATVASVPLPQVGREALMRNSRGGSGH